MIQFVRHKNINIKRWDELIASSQMPLVSVNSWFLDAVSPDWDALICDDYSAVMPIVKGPRFGIRYLQQPISTQQLGVFGINVDSDVVSQFIKRIPIKFKLIDNNFNARNTIAESPKYFLEKRTNFLLDFSLDYEDVVKKYSSELFDILQDAKQLNLLILEKIAIDQIVDLFDCSSDVRLRDRISRQRFCNLLESAQNRNCLYTSGVLKRGSLLAVLVVVKEFDRYTILKLVSHELPQSVEALLLDYFIRKHSSECAVFDFSTISQINPLLCQQFGASEENFTNFKMNRLPIILKYFKK